jgi:UDP-N-acetylmuramate dehydrogenase
MNIQEHVLLAPLTTFGIGGPARYLIECTSIDDIHEAIAYCAEHKLKSVVLSGGSNVLVSDEGFDGCVLHIRNQGSNRFGNTVVIEAGCTLLGWHSMKPSLASPA